MIFLARSLSLAPYTKEEKDVAATSLAVKDYTRRRRRCCYYYCSYRRSYRPDPCCGAPQYPPRVVFATGPQRLIFSLSLSSSFSVSERRAATPPADEPPSSPSEGSSGRARRRRHWHGWNGHAIAPQFQGIGHEFGLFRLGHDALFRAQFRSGMFPI